MGKKTVSHTYQIAFIHTHRLSCIIGNAVPAPVTPSGAILTNSTLRARRRNIFLYLPTLERNPILRDPIRSDPIRAVPDPRPSRVTIILPPSRAPDPDPDPPGRPAGGMTDLYLTFLRLELGFVVSYIIYMNICWTHLRSINNE